MGENDDRAAESHDRGSVARRRGRATDGRPYVMVLAVAPWTAPGATTSSNQAPVLCSTRPSR